MSSQLVWKGAPGNIIAQGGRGTYTIQSLSTGTVVLQAVDGEARAKLPFLGQAFPNLTSAKNRAAAIEDGL